MTVGYDVTIEDVAEVGYKAVSCSQAWPRMAARRRWSTSLLNAFVAFIITLGNPDTIFRVTISALAFVLTALMWPPYEKWYLRRNLRRLTRGYFGQTKTTKFSVTISDAGIATSMLGSDTVYAWSNVKAINLLDDRIDIWLALDNLIAVRDKAFATPEQKQHFVASLRSFSQLPV